jgi:hypothetical protein
LSRRKGKKANKPPKQGSASPDLIVVSTDSAEREVMTLAVLGKIERTIMALESGECQDTSSVLGEFDFDGKIIPRLDKNAVASLLPEHRGEFFRVFCSAVWTQLARDMGLLAAMEGACIIKLGLCPAKDQIPAIGPIADDEPSFATPFLGTLQETIKARLVEIGFIPARHVDADLSPPGTLVRGYGLTRAEKAREEVPFGEYLRLVQAATGTYLVTVMGEKPELAAKAARLFRDYIFFWLGCQNILQDIISGLVNGLPSLRKVLKRDGSVEFIICRDEPPPPCFEPAD